MAIGIRPNCLISCQRWFKIIGTVLIVRLTRYDNVIYLSSQDMKDACKIAKHLKMGVKEKDGEIYLEEAIDWRLEYHKIWLQEDLIKIFKVIGLEDLEAWKKKYNIITNNLRLKLEMLRIINTISKNTIKEYNPPQWNPEGLDEFIKKTVGAREWQYVYTFCEQPKLMKIMGIKYHP
jgi:hypothetical protein